MVLSQWRAVVWWLCFERTSASQTLLSQRITVPRRLFLQQGLRHTLRSHLFARPGLVGAFDERQPDAPAGRCRPGGSAGQAAPEQVGDGVLEPSVLLDGADLHRAHYVVRQIERSLHGLMVPESWFSGWKRCRLRPPVRQGWAGIAHHLG